MDAWPQPLWQNDHVTSTFVAQEAQPLWQKGWSPRSGRRNLYDNVHHKACAVVS